MQFKVLLDIYLQTTLFIFHIEGLLASYVELLMKTTSLLTTNCGLNVIAKSTEVIKELPNTCSLTFIMKS